MMDPNAVHPWVADRARVRFGAQLPGNLDWPATRDRVQAAEQLGFDSVWLPDHPLLGWDSWTQLAAVAAVTSKIRLGTMVSCVYYRNPVVLARIVADVDRISGGRVILGLGSGDMPWEFEQLGLAYPSPKARAEVLEEALEVVPPLLRGERVEYQGKAFNVRGATLNPPAVQKPHIPILVAGGGERTTLRLAAKHADGSNMGAASWAGGAFSPEDSHRKFEVLRSHCVEIGRPFEAILRTCQIGFILADTADAAAAMRADREKDPVGRRLLTFLEGTAIFCTPDEAVDRLAALRAAGFEYFVGNAGIGVAGLERFARDLMRPITEMALPAS